MKSVFLFYFILLNLSYTVAQSYWFNIIATPNDQSPVSDIIIKNNNYYFSVIERNSKKTWENYHAAYYKVSLNGQVVYSDILHDANINLIGTTEVLQNGNILGLGHIYLEEFENIFAFWQVEFNDEFDIISQKIDTFDMKYSSTMNSFTAQNGQIYFHAMTSDEPFWFGQDNVYLSRLSQDKIILRDTIIETGSYDFSPNIINNNILIQTRGLDQNSGADFIQVNELDTNFMFISTPISYIPDSMRYYFSIHLSNDSNYYFAAMRTSEGGGLINSHAAVKTSTSLNQLYYRDFDTIPHYFYTCNHNGIDTYNENVYTGGSLDYAGMQGDNPNYFVLTQMDTTLNIINQRFYGGDKIYWLSSIKTTLEGDVILLGYCGELNSTDWNIFIMKVDPNGLITSNSEDPSIPIKNAIVLPNPGTNYLQLHTGIYPASFKLYNISGQVGLEEKISSETSQVNTSHLKSGTYIWQLLKDGQEVESGKWVKE